MLNSPGSPGESTREAIHPFLHGWLNRKHRSMSFHLTQIITGYGCMGHYLYRMQKKLLPECQHCQDEDDTIVHILRECPAWDTQQDVLMRELNLTRNNNLTLRNIVTLILKSSANWNCFQTFVISKMRLKEEEEKAIAVSYTVTDPTPRQPP